MEATEARQGISRRGFVAGAAVGTAGAMALAGMQARADEAAGNDFLSSVAWDNEYDVVIIGFGPAGASAAVAASEEGASVLLIEKAPLGREGGNAPYAGQGTLSIYPGDEEKAATYLKALRGDFNTPSDEMIDALAVELAKNLEWFESHGAESVEMVPFVEYDYEGSETMNLLAVNGEFWTGQNWRVIRGAALAAENVDVWYESRVMHLIQDPATGVVHGAEVHNGDEVINVRARNGIVLCCGGFENNMQMIQDYLQVPYGYAKGAHYNEGDGILMGIEVGARLWHMSNGVGPDPNFVNPETGNACGYCMQGQQSLVSTGFSSKSVIFVGGDGTRFVDEGKSPSHGFIDFHGTHKHMHVPVPAFAIFDEAARVDAPIYTGWSEQNEAEVEKGWITKADTIEQLAEMIGLDPEALSTQVATYNQACADGVDVVLGRSAETLNALAESGPYYAMELSPTYTNTQGGPERDPQTRIISTTGEPIPHLFGAGELGAPYADMYQAGGNLGEACAFGRLAGRMAAAAKDDAVMDSLVSGEPKVATWEEATVETAEGEYLGTADGIGGPLTVKVAYADGTISSVEVVDHHETDGIGTNAIDALPAAIVEAQSTDVDTVAGATVTSRAILEAVANALAEAGN